MKCERCKMNDATVFYREIINGTERSYALCEDCAKKENIGTDFSMPSPDSLFLSLLGINPAKSYRHPSVAEKRCDLCGISFRDFARSGKAGCPRCYQTFRDELASSLDELHGGRVHKGRHPKHGAAATPKAVDAPKSEADLLREEMQKAIAEENFEKAAQLRDQIKKLEG